MKVTLWGTRGSVATPGPTPAFSWVPVDTCHSFAVLSTLADANMDES